MTIDAIDVTLDEELRRRKRNLRILMLLAMLPIVGGSLALALYQPAQAVDVRPIVRQEVQRTIEPQIATQVSAQVSAQVSQQVSTQVNQHVAPLERSVTALNQRAFSGDPKLRTRVAELEKQVAELRRIVAALEKRAPPPSR